MILGATCRNARPPHRCNLELDGTIRVKPEIRHCIRWSSTAINLQDVPFKQDLHSPRINQSNELVHNQLVHQTTPPYDRAIIIKASVPQQPSFPIRTKTKTTTYMLELGEARCRPPTIRMSNAPTKSFLPSLVVNTTGPASSRKWQSQNCACLSTLTVVAALACVV